MTVMITNGNNVHSPAQHAEVTATKILEIAKRTYPEEGVFIDFDVRKKVEAALLAHHSEVHNDEQSKIAKKGVEHCNSDLDSSHHADACDEIYAELQKAVAGSRLQHIFERDDVRQAIIADLHHETRSQMNVHRIVHKRGEELKAKH